MNSGQLVYPSITNSFNNIEVPKKKDGLDHRTKISVVSNGGSLEYFIEDEYGLASFEFENHITYSLDNTIHFNNYNKVPYGKTYTTYVYVRETNILGFKGKIGNNNVILYKSTVILESPHKPISIYVGDYYGEPE